MLYLIVTITTYMILIVFDIIEYGTSLNKDIPYLIISNTINIIPIVIVTTKYNIFNYI